MSYDSWKLASPPHYDNPQGECRKCGCPFDVDELTTDNLCPLCEDDRRTGDGPMGGTDDDE